MDDRFSKYESFFGRRVDYMREPQANVHPPVSVCRIPPAEVSFFRRFSTPVFDRTVYITYGMSAEPMHIPADKTHIYPARIELISYCMGGYLGAKDGQDLVSAQLVGLAAMAFGHEMFFGPMQTASLEEPMCPGTSMTAFFFAVPDGVDMKKLCSCTPAAELVVSVMPITSTERAYAVSNGIDSLLQVFEEKNVPNFFDVYRPSAV